MTMLDKLKNDNNTKIIQIPQNSKVSEVNNIKTLQHLLL